MQNITDELYIAHIAGWHAVDVPGSVVSHSITAVVYPM